MKFEPYSNEEYSRVMKKFSANYSNTNHNFVIQNIQSKQKSSKHLPAICILKNILQRGKPTLMSTFLQENIGSIHKTDKFNIGHPLIDSTTPKWNRIIKGDVKGNFFPAQQFFDELIPKYLSEYQYIQQLLIPEIPINEITQVDVEEFRGQQVDFYLPQAALIIEIDGSQHIESEDKIRDNHTKKYGIRTIRIKVSDLNEENEIFLEKIQQIIARIEGWKEFKKQRHSLISLDDYALAFKSKPNLDNPFLISTAVIRFQLFILELLETGVLSLDNDWDFELIERDISGFSKIAIKDLFIWFDNILKLHKIDFTKPKITFKKVKSLDKFSNDKSKIKIDFSILKRYTDEFQDHSEVYFVRTDYLDNFIQYKKDLKDPTLESYDYFKLSTTKLINYKLTSRGKNSDEKPLLFLIWNIFLQAVPGLSFDSFSFREGQLPIILNALARRSTLGLLPTGSGKSVCYQLCAILQPAVSFVVSPIKALMYDQKADLDLAFFSRTNHITSDDDGEDKEKILNDYRAGKYLFIYISPERFQIKKFREHFISVNKNFNIAYAVIDEIHCLSEWGHSFRTSYLTLADTIDTYCNKFTYIGLTATASERVKNDIVIELNIEQENIFTPPNYTREELEFIAIDDKNDKDEVLLQLLNKLKDSIGALKVDGENTRCGLIFTTLVNRDKGCYMLSTYLSSELNADIRYYSGGVPTDVRKENKGNRKIFDDYKKLTQNDYKENKYSLLVATNAFGMGINKSNIHYTIHYGIPSSIEALYQEGGRAGRDKTKFIKDKAKCYVLLSKSSQKKEYLDQIWDRNSTLEELEDIEVDGDINSHHYMFVQGNTKINEDLKIIKEIYELAIPSRKNYSLKGADLKSMTSQKKDGKIIEKKLTKYVVERSLYRLKQLGVVKDWTISQWGDPGAFEVDFTNFTDSSIKESLLSSISKYDKEFSLEAVMSNERYSRYKEIIQRNSINIDKYIELLLYWSYDSFAYNRRQSLKNVYENTCQFADGEISSKEFKQRLENYFKIDQLTTKFQDIADNELEFKEWFNVFYKIDRKNKTKKFITLKQQQGERDSLSRFLESERDNTGLNLISGLIRLLLDDYENSDGRNRLEGSLKQIKSYKVEDKNFIIDEIIKIGKNCNDQNKNLLAESLFNIIDNSIDFLYKLSLELEDTYSTYELLTGITNKLTRINEENYGRLEKIG
mgnify:CR=1 FL=1